VADAPRARHRGELGELRGGAHAQRAPEELQRAEPADLVEHRGLGEGDVALDVREHGEAADAPELGVEAHEEPRRGAIASKRLALADVRVRRDQDERGEPAHGDELVVPLDHEIAADALELREAAHALEGGVARDLEHPLDELEILEAARELPKSGVVDDRDVSFDDPEPPHHRHRLRAARVRDQQVALDASEADALHACVEVLGQHPGDDDVGVDVDAPVVARREGLERVEVTRQAQRSGVDGLSLGGLVRPRDA